MKTKECRLILFLTLTLAQFNVFGQQPDLSARGKNLRTATGKEIKLPYSNMALSAKFIGTALGDPNWYYWCTSPIQGQDKKIHLFCSRWPAAEGMEGWSGPKAEIAHFVGDRPEGPFQYVRTIMKTAMFPDQATMAGPHNPRLEYVDGKYILLYICQDPSGKYSQRIGMMIADKLDGPWRYAGHNKGIMVTRSSDPNHWTYHAAIGTDNPAFLKIGKKYYIYFKCGTPDQMASKYGYAVSERLEGPYTPSDAPITDNVSYLEDAQAFAYKNKYYLLTTDNLGGNTGVYGDLILWESGDGLKFKLSDAKIAMGNLLDYWGTEQEHKNLLAIKGHFERARSGKLERPGVLFLKGKPAYLYAAADLNIHGGKVAESYVFKIDFDGKADKEHP